MKKKTKGTKRSKVESVEIIDEDTLDYRRLCRAAREASEWALDVAAMETGGDLDELEAVERVRTYVRLRLAGSTARISLEDALFAFGLLIAAIERDVGPLVSIVSSPLDAFDALIADDRDLYGRRRAWPTSWLEHYLAHARTRA